MSFCKCKHISELHSIYSFLAINQERNMLVEMEEEMLAFGRIEAWSLEDELGMTMEEIKVWQDSLGFDNSSTSPDDSFLVDDEEDVIVDSAAGRRPNISALDDDGVSSVSSGSFSDWLEGGELYVSQVSCSYDESDDDASDVSR
jgi:hypothetical protein